MDNSTLDIDSLSISDPTATSFQLTQHSTIRSDSAYHPTLDAFNASLSLKGSASYADITIPSIDAEAVASSVIDQAVQIKDMKRFTEYNVALLNSESVTMEIVGRTGLHEMKFPETTVDYRKTVTIKGTSHILFPLQHIASVLVRHNSKTETFCQASTNLPASPSPPLPSSSPQTQTAQTWSAKSTFPTPPS